VALAAMPGRAIGVKAKVKAKRASQVQLANQRRNARFTAVRQLNALAKEIRLPGNRVPAPNARDVHVERLVKLLEARLTAAPALSRLHAAAKLWSESGGEFASSVLQEDHTSPALVGRHRVLLPTFRLKSKAFMLTYNGSAITAGSFNDFRDFVVDLKARLGARAWAACLEKSLHAAVEGRHHLHAYLLWSDGHGIDVRSLEPLYFLGIRPRVDVCTARAAATSPHTAACHGLWYVSIHKAGTVAADTNYPEGQWYKARARWLENLFEDGKMPLAQYIKMSAEKFPAGHAARKRDAEEAFRDARNSEVREHVRMELEALRSAGAYEKPRSFPIADAFIELFAHGAAWRRPILLIVGGTNLGKSMLAGDILERVAKALKLQEGSFLEVTVEGDGHLDLAEFDLKTHGCVLLDGVGDVLLLKKARETLQGRPKVTKGARSATMRYAYAFTLARRAVVATLDLSADNLHLLHTDHWLSDKRNVMVLRLTTACFGPASSEDPPPVSKLEEMQGWAVKTVAGFLEQADLQAPAALLRSNGVNGADLATLTHQQLVEELRLSPFAAGKVIAARDDFLNA
jgi:hypothetical protein